MASFELSGVRKMTHDLEAMTGITFDRDVDMVFDRLKDTLSSDYFTFIQKAIAQHDLQEIVNWVHMVSILKGIPLKDPEKN